MEIIIFTIIFAAILGFIILKLGNLSFWKRAGKNPDFVYEHLLKDNAWVIDDGTSDIEIDKNKYDGPFLLFVPSINRIVKFYGEIGKYEESQKRLEEKLT